MFSRDWRAGQSALGVGLVAAISVAASLGAAAGESPASALPSVRAELHDGILQITGTPGADKVALGLKRGNSSVLDVDVGDDGTVDFSVDRGTLRAINVQGGAGDDAIRTDETSGPFGDDPVTLDGDAGHDTLVFNGDNASEHMDLCADSSHVHLSRDAGDVTMDLSAIETADINTVAGNDTASVAFGVSCLIRPIIDLGADE